jgi:hypothetical protein
MHIQILLAYHTETRSALDSQHDQAELYKHLCLVQDHFLHLLGSFWWQYMELARL